MKTSNCPYCNYKALLHGPATTENGGYQVRCTACGMRGPEVAGMDEARREWASLMFEDDMDNFSVED